MSTKELLDTDNIIRKAIREFDLSEIDAFFSRSPGFSILPYARFLPNGLKAYRTFVQDASDQASLTRNFLATIAAAIREKGYLAKIKILPTKMPESLLNHLFSSIIYNLPIAKAYCFDPKEKERLLLRSIGLQLGYSGPWPEIFPDPAKLQLINPEPDETVILQVGMFCRMAFFNVNEAKKLWIAQRLPNEFTNNDIWQCAMLVCDRHYSSKVRRTSVRHFSLRRKDMPEARAWIGSISKSLFLQTTQTSVFVPMSIFGVNFRQAIQFESSLLVDLILHMDRSIDIEDLTSIEEIRVQITVFERDMSAKAKERISAMQTRATLVAEAYPESERAIISDALHAFFDKFNRTNPFKPMSFDAIFLHFERVVDAAITNAINATSIRLGAVRVREQAGLDNYPSLFPEARKLERRIIAHLGPTNSGKTHVALEVLQKAATGMYLAPLRLMALEVFDRMIAVGLECAMSTGEEYISTQCPTHLSATVEMCDLFRPVDVAVIDEGQLLNDRDRGWAWTQALVGVPAKEIHVTGSQDGLPFIAKVAQLCGDELEVRRYERKGRLEALPMAVKLSEIQPGDALIAFSRASVFYFRQILLERGFSVACIYGALGPEIRRTEATRFRSGEADVLVATDAIGLGLNLPVSRVIFTALDKFDGSCKRALNATEIKQIGGRAGRYGITDLGSVGVLSPLKPGRVVAGLNKPAELPFDTQLFVNPPWSAVQIVADHLGIKDLAENLLYISKELISRSPQLKATSLEGALQICALIARSNLSLRDQYRYLGCPINLNKSTLTWKLRNWARIHGAGGRVESPECRIKTVPDDQAQMEACEDVLNEVTVYTWLAMRWPDHYPEIEKARETRNQINLLIETALARKVTKSKPKLSGLGAGFAVGMNGA